MQPGKALLKEVVAGVQEGACLLSGHGSWSLAARGLSVASSRFAATCLPSSQHHPPLFAEWEVHPLPPRAALRADTAALQAVRLRHTLTKPLLVQSTDVLHLSQQIDSAQSLEELAFPVLQHSDMMQPQQVLQCLTRIPCFTSRGPAQLRSTVATVPEQLQLPALLISSLAARLQQLLPHCTPEQLAHSLWGIATTRSRMRMPSMSAAAGSDLADPNEHAAAAPPIHLLPAVKSLTHALYQQLLQEGVAGVMPTAPLACVAWSLAALQPSNASTAQVTLLLQLIGNRLEGLSAQQVCEQLGWRGIVQLLAAAERSRKWASGEGTSKCVTSLTHATSHLLQQHLQAADARPHMGGLLLPRALYKYRALETYRTLDKPLPPKQSKYLRSTLPYVKVLDFTPQTLVPCLRAIHLLQPDGASRAALMDVATQHLLAMLPRHPPLQRAAAGRQRAKPLSKAESITRAIEGVDPNAASLALQQELTARYRWLQPRHAVQLMQILDIERPAEGRRLASRLLQYISAAARLRTVDVLSGLNVAAALRLSRTSQGVRGLLQHLERITDAHNCAFVLEATEQPASQISQGNATGRIARRGIKSREGDESSQQVSDKAVVRDWPRRPLRANQLARTAACLVHLRLEDTAAKHVLLSIVGQAQRVEPSQWDAKSVGILLAAIANTATVCFGGVDTRSQQARQVLVRESHTLFNKLQAWSIREVSFRGGVGAVWCAAGLACWPNHDPDTLKRVARRALQMHENLLPRQAELLRGWVSSLPGSLRGKLQTALQRANPEHKLLPYLAQ